MFDGLVQEITTLLDDMTKELSQEAIEAMGEFRNRILDDLEECQGLIEQSREDLNTRDEVYRRLYDEWFESLLQYKKELQTSVVAKIVDIQRKREIERTESIRLQLKQAQISENRYRKMTWLTIGGLIITTIGLVITTIIALL